MADRSPPAMQEVPSIKGPLILGAGPLLLWPFVALASIMSLAGQRSGNEPLLLTLVAGSFQLGSLLYPAVYVGALVTALTLKQKGRHVPARRISFAPLWAMLALVILFVLWFALE